MRRWMSLALAVAVLAVGAAARSADAAVVRLVHIPTGPGAECLDPCLRILDGDGVADTLVVVPKPDCCGVIVAGDTARAGPGCADGGETPTGQRVVTCSLAEGQELSSVEAELGAGDDRLVVHPAVRTSGRIYPDSGGPLPSVFEGEDGADVIEARDEIRGGPGNDVLRLNVPSSWEFLDGGDGDDQLYAGASPATLYGGAGADVLHGGAGNDALISGGDPGGRDRVLCGGGRNLVQQDRDDSLECPARSRINVLTQVRHRWFVLRRYTYPRLLDIRPLPRLPRVDAPISVRCDRRACRGARFRPGSPSAFERTRVKLVRGGVRVSGLRGRAVLTGASIEFRMVFHLQGGVLLEKRLRFIARFHRLPRVRKRCTITRGDEISDRPLRVPCF